MARCGCTDSGACACFIDGGDGITVTGAGSELSHYVITTSAMLAATPFTVETMPNPIAGGTMNVLMFPPSDNAVLAIGITGDAFPRLLMPADADSAVMYLGDGTSDPYSGGSFIGQGNADEISITNSVRIRNIQGIIVQGGAGDVEVTDIGSGVILRSPDNTRYRITVNNDGSLSTAVA